MIDLTWENGPIRQIPGDAHQQWLTLSEHGRRISRYVAAAPGEVVLGAGFDHPRAAHRSAFLEQQASELGTDIAAQWWAKR